jgi:hypothetical protein
MILDRDIMNDTHILNAIQYSLSHYTPDCIQLSYDVSNLHFTLRAKTLIISYDVRNETEAINLRRTIVQSYAKHIILNGSTNLVHYIRENTICSGSGLFGAVLRNSYIKSFTVWDYKSGSGSGGDLKHDLKKEQRNYYRNMITPIKKIKIRIVS